jgi:hypothetical protein
MYGTTSIKNIKFVIIYKQCQKTRTDMPVSSLRMSPSDWQNPTSHKRIFSGRSSLNSERRPYHRIQREDVQLHLSDPSVGQAGACSVRLIGFIKYLQHRRGCLKQWRFSGLSYKPLTLTNASTVQVCGCNAPRTLHIAESFYAVADAKSSSSGFKPRTMIYCTTECPKKLWISSFI